MSTRIGFGLLLIISLLAKVPTTVASEVEFYNSIELFGPDSILIDDPAYAELWVDGGDGVISPLGSGDDQLIDVVTADAYEGYFYGLLDMATASLTSADRVFVRVYDSTGGYYMNSAALVSLSDSDPFIPAISVDFSADNTNAWMETGAGSEIDYEVTMIGLTNGQTIRGNSTITVTVSPAGSPDEVRVEYRAVGEETWTELPSPRLTSQGYQLRVFANTLSRNTDYEIRAAATFGNTDVVSDSVTVTIKGSSSPWASGWQQSASHQGGRRSGREAASFRSGF